MARSSGSLPSLKVSTPVTSHNGFQRMHLGSMLAFAGTEGGASRRLMGVHYQQTPSSRQLFTSTAVCTCCFTCFQPSSNLVVVVRGNTGGQQGPLAPLTTACVRAAGQIRERTASDPATKWVSWEGPVLFVSSPLVGLLSVGAFFLSAGLSARSLGRPALLYVARCCLRGLLNVLCHPTAPTTAPPPPPPTPPSRSKARRIRGPSSWRRS